MYWICKAESQKSNHNDYRKWVQNPECQMHISKSDRMWPPSRHWCHNTEESEKGTWPRIIKCHIRMAITDQIRIGGHGTSYSTDPCTRIPAPSHRDAANNAENYAWQHILARAQCGKHWDIHEWSSERLMQFKNIINVFKDLMKRIKDKQIQWGRTES